MATAIKNKTEAAIRFAHHAEQLSLLPHEDDSEEAQRTTAVEARFITPRDPVIETVSGDRLPAVPLNEATKLNKLKDQIHGVTSNKDRALSGISRQDNLERENERDARKTFERDELAEEAMNNEDDDDDEFEKTNTTARSTLGRTGAPLRAAIPPSRTNPLFPPLPLYGPPSFLRTLQCNFLRFTSFCLSLGFLAVIVLGSAFTSIPLMLKHVRIRLKGQNPDARRPFYEEEVKRKKAREEANQNWMKNARRRNSVTRSGNDNNEEDTGHSEDFIPTEGGPDPLICDAGYYARRVGLDVEEFRVQTEDGFIIRLWHVYNPKEYRPATEEERQERKPVVFPADAATSPEDSPSHSRIRRKGPRRYPVLLIHGLLQSAGAYCTNDEDSLAFYLAKQGYDVWLGNNRCGFEPEHTLLKYNDPRMWCFNIRQMGVLDLPALVSRVLTETGFPKLGLVCHSQGTTQTFVALAKEQRPDLGTRISVFCALAPAVYAGPLIDKMYFKFMKVISPAMFRVFFGIHAFIPFMMDMHRLLPGTLYGAMGYRVFSFLFNWSDERWERDLRDRCFQFAPVYVSAESMRWWLGRECFAKHKCILSTREENRKEDAEDAQAAAAVAAAAQASASPSSSPNDSDDYDDSDSDSDEHNHNHNHDAIKGNGNPNDAKKTARQIAHRGRRAWYDAQAPPMALWIAGSDKLVDGRRLLRRFERGREPHVRIVHAKVIPEYEHLDVLWAMDAIEKVGREVKEVIWRTAEQKEGCVLPRACEDL